MQNGKIIEGAKIQKRIYTILSRRNIILSAERLYWGGKNTKTNLYYIITAKYYFECWATNYTKWLND